MVWGPNLEHASRLYNINIFATTLSTVGSLFMCFCCISAPSPRNVSLKLISVIAVSDLVYSITNILSAFQDPDPSVVSPLCVLEGFLRFWTFEFSLFFASCISILCYKTCSFNRNFNQEAFFKRCISLGTLLCLGLGLFSYLSNKVVYVNSDLFCAISSPPREPSVFIRLLIPFIFQGIPVLTGLFVTCIGYVLTVRKIKSIPEEILDNMHVAIYKLYWYPALLFMTFLPSTIDNFISAYWGRHNIFEIKAFHLLMTHSIGFTNAIVYGIQRRLYETRKSNFEPSSDDLKAPFAEETSSFDEKELWQASAL